MTNNSHELTRAFNVLGDYFSRLGGAARYLDMSESDIPLYIACQLVLKHSSIFDQRDYIIDQFLEAAAHILPEVHSHLDKVTAQDKELERLICEFVDFANSKLKHDRTERWDHFVKWVNQTITIDYE